MMCKVVNCVVEFRKLVLFFFFRYVGLLVRSDTLYMKTKGMYAKLKCQYHSTMSVLAI